MMGFRHADWRLPFLWEHAAQPAARWHAEGEGPVHYFADTPDGAWAEFLRHEEITSEEDIATITRSLWVAELPDDGYAAPRLARATLTGGMATYEACRAEARRLAASRAMGLRAPSAALRAGGAAGWRADGGLQPGPARDGLTVVLFGPRPDLVGWHAAQGRPAKDLLKNVRPLAELGPAWTSTAARQD
jgi:hypothetical protein